MNERMILAGLLSLVLSVTVAAQQEGARDKAGLRAMATAVTAGEMPVAFTEPGRVNIEPVVQGTGPATQVKLNVYASTSATTPVQSTSAPLTALVCNLAAGVNAVSVNEARAVAWADPNNVGRECQLDFKSFFGGLPVGNYAFAVVFTDSTGLPTSAESAKSSPLVQLAPAPTGFRVIK